MSTAGRTVMFSGLTISTSLLALLIFPSVFAQCRHGGDSSHSHCDAGSAHTPTRTLSSAWSSGDAFHFRACSDVVYHRSHMIHLLKQRCVVSYLRNCYATSCSSWAISTGTCAILGLPFLRVTFATSDVKVLSTQQDARIVSDRLSQDPYSKETLNL